MNKYLILKYFQVSQSHLEEETVAREIADKLGYTSGISYTEIASTASEYGRKKLAIKVSSMNKKYRSAISRRNCGLFLWETRQ